MKTKILGLEQIKLDESVYPRNMTDWMTVERYKGAMKSGAKFPPITVARFEGDFICVDGFHRIDAYKQNKETHVEAEILEGLTKNQIFVEAVKRNIGHGRMFSSQERTRIILTLEEWNISQEQISEIIRIPVDKLKPFVAKRMTRITETHEQIVLKSPLKHLAGIDMEKYPEEQSIFQKRTQVGILNALIALLENKWINQTNKLIMEKLRKIHKLITPYLKS